MTDIDCIMCALDIEYQNIKKYFKVNMQYKVDDSCELSECSRNNIIIVKSGIGKHLAKKYTEYVIHKYNSISCIYSTGIAGAISPALNIGDIVISNKIIDLSQDTLEVYESKWNEQFYLNILNDKSLYAGEIVSSDFIVNNSAIKNSMFLSYNSLCVEMESAGVIRACNEYQIPFVAIKGISDYADGKANISMLKSLIKVTEYFGRKLSDIFTTTGVKQ